LPCGRFPQDNAKRMGEENWLKRIQNCNLQSIKENEMLEREFLALSGIQVSNL
jgi:hypothetical protein